MMFMTAKVDKKKVIIAAAAAVAVIVVLILIFSGGGGSTQTVAPAASDNDARVEFLRGFGWDVAVTPVKSGQVRIPKTSSDVYDRYNDLQKSQGYDLTAYAGKTVMRYVYQINNYPDASDPVYATLLVYKNQIIGGDVTNTAAKGVVSGFKMPAQQQPALTTPPEEPTAPRSTQ